VIALRESRKEEAMRSTEVSLDPSRPSGLDRHFTLPAIRRVPARQPFVWLRRGWNDLRCNLRVDAAYGIAFALGGGALLFLAGPRPYLFTAVVSGFMLLAPILAAGLYEVSRRQGEGLTTGLRQSLDGWTRNADSIEMFGLLLVLIAIGWERLSAILFALFYTGDLPSVQTFFRSVFLSGDYAAFVLTYVAIGALLAAAVFAMSAISVPMLVDRKVDILTAIATSLEAVRRNMPAMALWAVLLVALTAVGFATLLVGMIVVVPWMAHASWHAYRDLAGPDPDAAAGP
jgi:uncharacterized membrane protein